MGKIVAIGGDDIEFEDKSKAVVDIPVIDKEIIKLSEKKNPKVLFIPTASNNSSKYIELFNNYFNKLGCKADVLLLDKNSKKNDFEEKILSTDVVYVGGGNTLRMMNLWRKLGVDKTLKKAFDKGIVLSGVSAGAICWFSYGHSDSRMFTSKGVSWPFIKVTGLSLFPFTFCPHYHFEKREKDFERLILRDGGIGLAVDNRAAIEIVDDKFRIIKSNSKGKVYRLKKNGKSVDVEELVNEDFLSISYLI